MHEEIIPTMRHFRCCLSMAALMLPVILLSGCKDSEPVAQPEAPTALELSYRILHPQRHLMLAVPESHLFSAGNQVRVEIKVNLDASIYVFVPGKGDDFEVLYPYPQANDGRVILAANEVMTVPVKGFFVLEAEPGTVEWVVIASRSPLKELESSIRGNHISESVWEDLVAPRLERAAKKTPVVTRVTGTAQRAEEAPWNTVAVQSDQAESCLIHHIKLTHGG